MTQKSKEGRNVPNLRFPGFVEEWIKTTIKKVANKITDGTHDTPKPTEEGVPYLTAIHVKDGFIDFDNSYYLPQDVHNKIYKRCNPEYGDLLMVNIGAGTATSAMVDVDFKFSLKNIALVKPNPEVIDKNLFAQIQRRNSDKLRHQISAGGAQPFLSLKEIAKLKLSIPAKLTEQQKIASFLTAIDKRIETQSKIIEGLKLFKKGMMQKIFQQGFGYMDYGNNSYSKWQKRKLGMLIDVTKGKQLNKEELTESGAYPCQNGGIEPSGYTEDFNTNENTITISEGGNSCGYVNYIRTKFWCGGHCYSLLNIKDGVINDFLYQYLKYNQHQIMRLRVGSGLPNIQKGDIINFKVVIPSLKEQKKIASTLFVIDNKIELETRQLEQFKTQKQYFLQNLFI